MSETVMSLEEALATPDSGSSTPQTIALSDTNKIPVTTPSYIQKASAPKDTQDAAPYALHLPFYPEANSGDEKATPIPLVQVPQPPPGAAAEVSGTLSEKDRLLYPVERMYSETLEKPAWAVFQLGFTALKAAYDFAPTDGQHDQLSTNMRNHITGWLGEAVDYYSKPEENADVTRNVTRTRALLTQENYHKNFMAGILGDTAEAATDLIAMLLPIGAASKFSKAAAGASLAADSPVLAEFAKGASKLAGYSFVRTNGSLSQRGESAVSMIAYSLTPYVAQATGFTGLPVKAVAAALNVFVSSPTYLAEFQAAGGMNREFATMFIPKFVFDIGFALFLKGLPEAEAKARMNKMIKHQVKEMKLPKAEAEKLIADIQIAVEKEIKGAEAEKAAEPAKADNKDQIAELKDRRHELMKQEVALLSQEGPEKGTAEQLKITRDRIRKLNFQIDKMEKTSGEPAPKEQPSAASEPVLANSDLSAAAPKTDKFERNRALQEKNKQGKLVRKVVENVTDLGTTMDAAFTPTSSILGRISRKLRDSLVKFEAKLHKSILDDRKAVMPFLNTWKEMTTADKTDFDYALKVKDGAKVSELVTKYDMRAEYDAARKVIDDLGARARESGFKFAITKDYFPRVVKDYKGLIDSLKKTENWSSISEAIREKQAEVGRILTEAEQAAVIDRILSEKPDSKMGLPVPGATRARAIQVVTPELNQFYKDSGAALLEYITSMNNAVEANRFFSVKPENVENTSENIIGQYVGDLISRKELSGEQAKVLIDALKARFNQGHMGRFVGLAKDIAIVDVLGGPASALRQLGDIGNSLYKNGYYTTVKSFFTGELRKEDLGLATIGQEFTDSRASAEVVRKVLGPFFTRFDNFGKKVVINAAFERLQRQAVKNAPGFSAKLESFFEADAAQVMADLKAGRASDNVKLLLFSELSEVQPISPSEMPPHYNQAGNGKILYLLKSYTIKQIDLYRREVLDQFRTDKLQAGKNLVSLTTSLSLAGAGADALTSLLLGKDFDLSDAVVNNLFKLFGFSTYLVEKAGRQGPLRTALESFVPPIRFFDNAFLDIRDAVTGDTPDPGQVSSIRSIPWGGELFYWWVGEGRTKIDKKHRGKANEAP